MNNDISGIMSMAGVTDDGLDGELYQSEASGNHSSQFTPNDLDTSIELEAYTTGKNKPRTKNFTPDEDLVLVSAWLNISLDPVRSTNQKADQYWKRIGKYFNESIEGKYGQHTDKSLRNRWGKIQQCVNKFCGYHTQLELARKSGATGHDLFEEAKMVYRSKENHDFQFDHCWNKLRHQCKWINLGSQGPVKKRAFSSDTINLDDEENPTADFVDLDRPPGVKKARDDDSDEQGKQKGKEKRKRKAGDTSQFDVTFSNYIEGKHKDDELKMEMLKQQMEMDKMKLNIKMMRVEADKERRDAKREKEDQEIMMMNVSKLETEMQRDYFAKLQADAFARRMSK